MEDPDKGPELLQREIEGLESQVSELKNQLREAKEKIDGLEKEKHDRYNKFKAEVYENSMMLMKEVQKGHNDALEATNKRITFLESELSAAQDELVRFDEVERELDSKRLQCIELDQALEEMEQEKQSEIEAAVELTRKHLEEEMKVRLVHKGESSSPCLKAEQKHKFNLERAMMFIEQMDGPPDDSDRTGKEEEAEVMGEQLEQLSEENDNLRHRLCDLEEKNKRLESQIQKLKDAERRNLELEKELHTMHDNMSNLEQSYQRSQMEQQIVFEMMDRNQQWPENRDNNSRRTESSKKNRSSSSSAGRSNRSDASHTKEIIDSHSSLFQLNDREFLMGQIAARDTMIRGLKNCSHRRASEEERQHATVQSPNDSQLVEAAAATDMQIYRKLRAAENEATQLREEVEGKQQQIEALISARDSPGGMEKDLTNILKRVAVVVPDHKSSIPAAVLEARDNNKAVFIRKGLYTWKGTINVEGCLRIIGQEGATLRGSWAMHSHSSGVFKGIKCESDSENCISFEGSNWKLQDCTFRGIDRQGEACELIRATQFTDLQIQECHFQVDAVHEQSCALMLDKSESEIERSSFNGTGFGAIVVKEQGRQELQKVACSGFDHSIVIIGGPSVSLLDNCSLGSLKGAFSVGSSSAQAVLNLRKETYILGEYCTEEQESTLLQLLGGEDKSFWTAGGKLLKDRLQKRHSVGGFREDSGADAVGSHRTYRVEVTPSSKTNSEDGGLASLIQLPRNYTLC